MIHKYTCSICGEEVGEFYIAFVENNDLTHPIYCPPHRDMYLSVLHSVRIVWDGEKFVAKIGELDDN